MPSGERAAGGWGGAYARAVVRFRWLVVLGWAVLACGSTTLLPDAPGSIDGGVEGMLSADAPAIVTEVRTFDYFRLPLLNRTVIVQRDPDGLPVEVQGEAVRRAAALSRGEFADTGPVVAAVPVPNTLGLFPGSREEGTTIVTWLFMPPDVSFGRQYAAARQVADGHYGAQDKVIGVTVRCPRAWSRVGWCRARSARWRSRRWYSYWPSWRWCSGRCWRRSWRWRSPVSAS